MIAKPKGTKDVLPTEVSKWHFVEQSFRDICRRYGYSEIRTPLFEYTKLFKRGVGETTDIVNKEMYSVVTGVDMRRLKTTDEERAKFFAENEKEGFTLKPEGTAPVVRAYIENKMYADAQPSKMYYVTPCFRHERPQAGRLRQFHQFGIEVFGGKEATADAEVIALADEFLRSMGLTNISLRINSIGCPKCRPRYNEEMKAYLTSKLDQLCGTCNDRFNTNPMRIIDCKNESCQAQLVDVPVMLDYLCEECETHFDAFKGYLDAFEIAYEVDTRIVRGLDYYTKTAFEFVSNDIGAQGTVCGGGRYDGLVEQMDGPATPGVGFGLGIERLLLAMENLKFEFPEAKGIDVFVAAMGDEAMTMGMSVLGKLRRYGLTAEIDHLKRAFKAQFKSADRLKSRYVFVIGEDELKDGLITVKNMETREQTSIKATELDTLMATIKG